MTRPNVRKQAAFKAGYASGRNGQMWNRGRINRNGNSVNAWYHSGKITLKDFVHLDKDPQWGDRYRQGSVRELVV